jgi:type IV secretion system protein VirB9
MKLLALVMLMSVTGYSSGAVTSAAAPTNADGTSYKLSGDRSVLPSAIHDDGARTYIQWGQSQSMPAVFGVDGQGREQLVNGFMRDGSFIIDRVYARLVFRIDDASASARRKSVRKK